jgi:bacterioferritin
MKAKEGVVDLLNGILTIDLTVINQYFVQSEMVRNWGYERLSERLRDLSIGEMKDAQEIIRRILYLEGLPNLQRLNQVKVGESPEEDLRLDLASEIEAVEALANAIKHCSDVGDHGTREMLEDMLRDEEEHIDWFESQIMAMEKIGVELYLAQHLEVED